MFSTMPATERNALIRDGAHWFAAERFKVQNPNSSPDDARQYAERHWREFVGDVIEWMALCDASDEAEIKAPWN